MSTLENIYLSLQVKDGNCPHRAKLWPTERKELQAPIRPYLSCSFPVSAQACPPVSPERGSGCYPAIADQACRCRALRIEQDMAMIRQGRFRGNFPAFKTLQDSKAAGFSLPYLSRR